MTIRDFGPQLTAAVHVAGESAKFYGERKQTLNRYLSSNLRVPQIQPVDGGDDTVSWGVWIPPHKESHFDGENIVGPYGDTYFSTIAEAAEFLATTLEWIDAGEPPFEMEDLGPVPLPEPTTTDDARRLAQQLADSWDHGDLAGVVRETIGFLEELGDPVTVESAALISKLDGVVTTTPLPPTLYFGGDEWDMEFPDEANTDGWYIRLVMLDTDGNHRAVLNLSDTDALRLVGSLSDMVSKGNRGAFFLPAWHGPTGMEEG